MFFRLLFAVAQNQIHSCFLQLVVLFYPSGSLWCEEKKNIYIFFLIFFFYLFIRLLVLDEISFLIETGNVTHC